MSIVALVPARSESKGVVDKNIKLLNGKSLIQYAIEAANDSELINQVFVSTDSEDYAILAKNLGAEVPFLRPKEISGDNSTDLECFEHFISYFQDNKISLPKFIVHLRPTTPIRDPKLIDTAIQFFIDNHKHYSSLRSVHEMSESAFKFCTIKSNKLKSIGTNSFAMDSSNDARQNFPKTYIPNGYIDMISVEYLLENKLLHGDRVYAYLTPIAYEVDSLSDFNLISAFYSSNIK